jgi:hypothetical protein
MYKICQDNGVSTWACQKTKVLGRLQLKWDGTRRRTGGKVKGKPASGVGSQYP